MDERLVEKVKADVNLSSFSEEDLGQSGGRSVTESVTRSVIYSVHRFPSLQQAGKRNLMVVIGFFIPNS